MANPTFWYAFNNNFFFAKKYAFKMLREANHEVYKSSINAKKEKTGFLLLLFFFVRFKKKKF